MKFLLVYRRLDDASRQLRQLQSVLELSYKLRLDAVRHRVKISLFYRAPDVHGICVRDHRLLLLGLHRFTVRLMRTARTVGALSTTTRGLPVHC